MRRRSASGAVREAGDLQLPGLHFDLRQVGSGQVASRKENRARPHAGEAARYQGGAAAAQARADRGTGEMAETGRQGLLQLRCGADQQSGAGCIPLLCHGTLATYRSETQPERRHDLGADHAVGQRLAPESETSFIHGQEYALPSLTQGGSRMRESRTYGSVLASICNDGHTSTEIYPPFSAAISLAAFASSTLPSSLRLAGGSSATPSWRGITCMCR